MKKKSLLFITLFLYIISFAQTTANLSSTNNINRGFQVSLRGGYDVLPLYNNNTPYIVVP